MRYVWAILGILALIATIAAAVAIGAGVFWLLKKLTKLPERRHLATHIGVRLFSALLSFAGVTALFVVLLVPQGHGGVEDVANALAIVVAAGVPALVAGAGLGQRTRRH